MSVSICWGYWRWSFLDSDWLLWISQKCLKGVIGSVDDDNILMREIFLWGRRGPFCSLKIPKKGPCASDCE
jgi:hypothetical protein